MSGRFELLVFDWDGTLADSLDDIVGAVYTAVASTGLPQRDRGQLLSIIGLGLEAGIEVLYPEESASVRAEVADAYRACYRRRASAIECRASSTRLASPSAPPRGP